MLVLGRQENEKIYIGDNIVLTVVEIMNNAVRIGIEAPSDMPIQREEVVVAKQLGITPNEAKHRLASQRANAEMARLAAESPSEA